MNSLIKKYAPGLVPVLLLEDLISHRIRLKIIKVLLIVGVISLGVFLFLEDSFSKGIFLIILGLILIVCAVEAYYYSNFLWSFKDKKFISFPFAEILLNTEESDIVRGFLFSDLGYEVMTRLGISEDKIIEYLKNRSKGDVGRIETELTDENFSDALIKIDSLKKFLVENRVTSEEFKGCFSWVVSMYLDDIKKERFWSENNLMTIPAIGNDWAFKKTYILEKIAKNLTDSGANPSQGFGQLYEDIVLRIERVLSKGVGANAVLVCESEEEGVDIVNLLAEKIKNGKIYPALKHKKVFLIEPEIIIENSASGKSAQTLLFDALAEALEAKNVVVVFPRFLAFVRSQGAGGADIISSVKPFLDSSAVNLVIIEDVNTFDEGQSEYSNISHSTEVVRIETSTGDTGVSLLQKEARNIERKSGAFITFGAIQTAFNEAKRNFVNKSPLDEARNILIETVPFVSQKGKRIILKDDILRVVEEKTGVPNRAPSTEEEKTKLLDLEKILHKRIIGQDEAIKFISSALRRSRAGISSKDRPIGSFLFLGPTGVGKTETAKALAEVMFGSDTKMSRLDMSEYQGTDALPRLIGSYGHQKQGSLSTLLRDNPYGVVLLDEFEKATFEIHNLFLQVLDEGFFTDGEAKKINARTSMFIATSNAGSNLIWDIVKSGEDLYSSKDKIIDEIIKQRIFTPELLNRFDGVVLFHPLLENELKQVAVLMLKSLNKRLEDKSISLNISPELLDFLVKKGTDPKFGARPMRRAIEEDIEENVAEGIIKGDLKSGMIADFEPDNDSVKLKI